MAWTTVKFIEAFFEGKLGRKRVHGTYRVLDGEHCKLLVRAITEYGRPAGSNLIGLNLNCGSIQNAAFWSSSGQRSFTYRMGRRIETDRWQELPMAAMNSQDEALIGSGIIDFDDLSLLIEIGDTPWLLHAKFNDQDQRLKGYGFIDRVPKRVSTVQEARLLTKDPEGQVLLCNEWWAEPKADDFVPPEFDAALLATMSTPLNPLDYGFAMNEVTVGSEGYGNETMRFLMPLDSCLTHPYTTKAKNWIAARDEWRKAATAWENRNPAHYQSLSISSKRFSRTSATGGEITRCGQGVYIRGTIHSMNDWNNVSTVGRWHKLMSPTRRLEVTTG
jgi:hypothetical protein